jgi:hypothetical protein
MLVGNSIDDITTSWHGEAISFDVNAPITSCIGSSARLNCILNLHQRYSSYLQYSDILGKEKPHLFPHLN